MEPKDRAGVAQDKLIVALDFPTWPEAEKLVVALPAVRYFKVGLELYLASGGQAVKRLREAGKEVFLDLKFHDIPNTVAQAARQAVMQEAALFNVHAAGGRQMMVAAAQAVQEQVRVSGLKKPLLIAVTVLTSLNEEDIREIGLQGLQETVTAWAKLAQKAGLDGVVASPQEIAIIREACGPQFKIICPGVRPTWAARGDQKRFMTPGEAISQGADFLVVGRPITQANDSQGAALRVIEEIEQALGG